MYYKSGIIGLLFLLWAFLSWQWYTCTIKGFCLLNNSPVETTTSAIELPFKFNKSSFVCIKGEGFQNYADSIKKLMNTGIRMTIIGLYDTLEQNKSTFKNLGLARAHRIKSLLAKVVDTSKISIQSKPFEALLPPEPFVAHIMAMEIEEIEDTAAIAPNDKMANLPESNTKQKVSKASSTENSEEVIIYFENNVIKKQFTDDEKASLNKIAAQVANTNEKLYITGHCNIGEKPNNDRIRAWVIKSALIKLGLNPMQLVTNGKSTSESVSKTNMANAKVVITKNK